MHARKRTYGAGSASAQIVVLLPDVGFDVQSVVVPWKILTAELGHRVVFATNNEGERQRCRIVSLQGVLGGEFLAPSKEFGPITPRCQSLHLSRGRLHFSKINKVAALIVPHSRHPKMVQLLRSRCEKLVMRAWRARTTPVAAIGHGVLLLAGIQAEDGNSHDRKESILYDRNTATLPYHMELSQHYLSALFHSQEYSLMSTEGKFVEEVVSAALRDPEAAEEGALESLLTVFQARYG